jgi:hypothetical protein
MKRDQSLRVRISKDELAMLRALAERTGVSGSDLIRLSIRRAFDDAWPPEGGLNAETRRKLLRGKRCPPNKS